MAGDGKDPILDFMVVRAPERVADAAVRRRYVQDRVIVKPPDGPMTHVPPPGPDPQALETVSPIGRIVYDLVFRDRLTPGTEADKALRDALLATLTPYAATTEPEPEPEPEPQPAQSAAEPEPPAPLPLRLDDLAAHAHLAVGDLYYILPDRLERLTGVPLIAGLLRLRPILDAASRPAEPGSFEPTALIRRIEQELGRPLQEVVFSAGGHSDEYVGAHRALFDALYLLYLMRRWTTVDLSDVIDGLQLLHALEFLALDALYTEVRGGSASQADTERVAGIAHAIPGLAGWDGSTDVDGLPAVTSAAALAELLDAHPLVNPLLTRCFWFRTPFNDITPIGVGDLKVVKQWLTAYLPGEISHIHNIMRGESRARAHRRTERSEEVFSLSTSRTEDVSKDTQSTERFEVKAEAENVVRASLNVTATANLTYNNSAAMITASAGAGFGYTRATEDHSRTAQNFARDVVAKAVERVQSQTASQRTLTQTFETEEKNTQQFDNTGGDAHISGIYRWVDKEYTAQVFNYGKRMMFEFVVPEPAAFWVESRLRAYENRLDVPQPPFPEPVRTQVTLPFTKDQIDEQLFATLGLKYDLTGLPPYPAESRTVAVRDTATRSRQFAEKDVAEVGHVRIFDASVVGANGYRAVSVHISGYGEFHHRVTDNRTAVRLNDRMVWEEPRNAYIWPYDVRVAPAEEIQFTSDETTVGIAFSNEIKFYDLAIEVTLERLPGTLARWRELVWATVLGVEEKRLEADFEEAQLAYQARLSEYRNRLDQVKAEAASAILAGRSDAANRLMIDEEMKKHCLTLLTKEFDSAAADDVLAKEKGTKSRAVETASYRLQVKEATKAGERTTVGYQIEKRTVDYPAIDLGVTSKATVVQFLEQAFEWERLSYVFYPYFWADETTWVELMNREDDTDATLTAFLRSGMARVLVAATPAYEDAVLYYLATREPWSGGRSPVIGDPLFVSLHDELRSQTDDRSGGVPEGDAWVFTVPTSLVYLHGSADQLPDVDDERGDGAAAAGARLQLVTSRGGRVRHTIRGAEGWAAWRDVLDQGAAGPLAPAGPVAAAGTGEQLHVLAVAGARIGHSIRTPATWTSWRDVLDPGAAGPLPAAASQVAAAAAGADLHVLAVHGGKLSHTIRGESAWTPWRDVLQQGAAGPLPAVGDVAAAAAGADLHVLAVHGGKLSHTIRGSGAWTPWRDVLQAGAAGPLPAVDEVAAAVAGGDLHVVARHGGKLSHAVRRAGAWTPWRDLLQPGDAGPLPAAADGIAVAAADGDVHVVAVHGGRASVAVRLGQSSRWTSWFPLDADTGAGLVVAAASTRA